MTKEKNLIQNLTKNDENAKYLPPNFVIRILSNPHQTRDKTSVPHSKLSNKRAKELITNVTTDNDKNIFQK